MTTLFTLDKEDKVIKYMDIKLPTLIRDNHRLERLKNDVNSIIQDFVTCDALGIDLNIRYSQLKRQPSGKYANYVSMCLVNEKDNTFIEESEVMIPFDKTDNVGIFIRVFSSLIDMI